MIECRKAHRSKSFIESKLKTQVKSENVDTDCLSFENKTSFSLEGFKVSHQGTTQNRLSFIFNLLK